jgi:uncharacterized membrane protein
MSCSSDSADRADDISDAQIPSRDTTGVSNVVHAWQGYAVHGHEVRSFRPCGWDDALWAIEATGLLWTLHQRLASTETTYQEVFAVVEARKVPAPTDGFGADYPGALEIEAVLYAGLEGPGCDEDWTAFQYRVHGNEPFWSAEVSNHHMHLSRLGSEDRFWNEIAVQRTHETVRYSGIDTTGSSVELIITEEPCWDSMSGSYYAYAAVLRIGEEKLHGCALQGQRQ